MIYIIYQGGGGLEYFVRIEFARAIQVMIRYFSKLQRKGMKELGKNLEKQI